MFEPQLEHNRSAFNSLTKRKWRAVLFLLAMIVPISVLVAMFPDSAWYIAPVFLSVASGVVIFYEVKKTLIFRRDLREQRELRKR